MDHQCGYAMDIWRVTPGVGMLQKLPYGNRTSVAALEVLPMIFEVSV